MKQLKPLAGYVLMEPLEEEEMTESGLLLPEKAKEKPAKGKVIAIGEAEKQYLDHIKKDGTIIWDQPQVKVGDIVVFHRWSGQDVKEGQKEYKLVQFKDLMGVYE